LIRRPTEALVYLRQTETQTMLVALNFYAWRTTVKLDERLPAENWELRLTSTPGGRPDAILADEISLAPFEASVWEAVDRG